MLTANDIKNLSEEARTFKFTEKGKERKFLYDTDLMSPAQIADAETKLSLYEKMLEVLPTTPTEFQEAMKKQALHRGLAALLVEVHPTNNTVLHEKYNPDTHTGLEVMEKTRGITVYRRLGDCKTNFFMQLGRISLESMKQFSTVISELQKEGIEPEVLNQILKAALDANGVQLKISQESSIPKIVSNRRTAKTRGRK